MKFFSLSPKSNLVGRTDFAFVAFVSDLIPLWTLPFESIATHPSIIALASSSRAAISFSEVLFPFDIYFFAAHCKRSKWAFIFGQAIKCGLNHLYAIVVVVL